MRHTAWLTMLAGLALAHSPQAVESAFGPGEQTTYDVSYLGLTAGRAEITVGWKMEQFGREVWPLVCVGETTHLASVFPLKDRFISYWDPVARQTVGADFFVHEDKYRARERYAYDFGAGEALVTRERPGRPRSDRRYTIQAGTVDLAAAGFALRNFTLVPGQSHTLPIFTGAKLYVMKATVVGKESLSTGLGKLEVYRVTFNGEFSGKLSPEGLMTIFFTADAKQLPVYAQAKLALGSVTLDAVKYEPGSGFTGAP